ncbi:MAG: ATP-dependent 6-phosphofructokinase, partial [Oligoflexia bacterium]|nr:ATP-dependent 6-phosphofructokinase [Oligoflexia bacterium]
VCEEIDVRLKSRGYFIIAVAEGAGQELMMREGDDKDASGNIKLKDIGVFLSDEIKKYFKATKQEINFKYIDPSYMIRSAPANATDAVFTGYLGEYAADAGMAGKTGMAVGYWKGIFTHVPLAMTISNRKVVLLSDDLWRSVLKSTGQPASLL